MDVQRIEADIGEIKESIREISRAMQQLALHSQRLDVLEKNVAVFGETVTKIRETCIQREHIYERGKEFLESGQRDPQSWWDSKVAGVVREGMAIFAGCLISAIVALYFR